MDLNWPPEKTFKYACKTRSEMEKEGYMTIKVEDNTINKNNYQQEGNER